MQFYIKSILIWTTIIALTFALRQLPWGWICWAGLISHIELLYGPLIAMMLAAQGHTTFDKNSAILALKIWVISVLIVIQFWVLVYSPEARRAL